MTILSSDLQLQLEGVSKRKPNRKWLSYDWRSDKDVMQTKSVCRSLFFEKLKIIASHIPENAKCLEIGIEKNLSAQYILGCSNYKIIDRDPEYRNVKADYVGDFIDISVDSNFPKFDVVLANSALEHTFSVQDFIMSAKRVLNPGGILILNTPFIHSYHCEPFDFWRPTGYAFKQIFEEAKMENIVSDDRAKLALPERLIVRYLPNFSKVAFNGEIIHGVTAIAQK